MPNNTDFDNVLVPFAGSDGGKSVLYELVQTKPSTIICGLRYSFLPNHGALGSHVAAVAAGSILLPDGFL
jgi:hypothetical protein